MNPNLKEAIEELAKIEGAKFVSLTYRNKEGELSRYVINVGLKTENVYMRALTVLEKWQGGLSGVEKEGCGKVVASLHKSLEAGIGQRDDYTCKGVYQVTAVPTIKEHVETGALYLTGWQRSRVVLQAGPPKKPVNSAEVTIARARFEKLVGLRQYRQFVLTADQLNSIRLNGKTLEILNEELVAI